LRNEGRLEVFYNGSWGTICSVDFDYLDAGVVCNTLGFGLVFVYCRFSISISVLKQEYVLWNAVSVPLLQFARYCSIVQTLSLKYPGRDFDLQVT